VIAAISDGAPIVEACLHHYWLSVVAAEEQVHEMVAWSLHDWAAASGAVVEHNRMPDVKRVIEPVVLERLPEVHLRLRVGTVAIVVVLLLSADERYHVAITSARLRPHASQVRGRHDEVGTREKRDVVHFEPGTAKVHRAFPDPVTSIFCQTGVTAITGQICRVGIEVVGR